MGGAVASGNLATKRFSKPPFERFALAGLTVTEGRAWQLDDEAAGCGGGVGLTPWNQVLVPYTPIGRLLRKQWLSQDEKKEGGYTYSSLASQFSNVPAL